jgi:hypothetical protein
MQPKELEEIVEKGLRELGLGIGREPHQRIARLSEGLPYYTHSLALHASQRALADDRSEIRNVDVDRAIDLAVRKAQHSIHLAYWERLSRFRSSIGTSTPFPSRRAAVPWRKRVSPEAGSTASLIRSWSRL